MKINNLKSLKINEVVEKLNYYMIDDVGEWFSDVVNEKGSGVYEFVIDNGVVDDIKLNDEYEENKGNFYEEFYFVENKGDVVEVCYSEESNSLFFNVVI